MPQFVAATFAPGEVVEAFVGLDGGSTSTKAVLMDSDRNVLVKSYSSPRATRSRTPGGARRPRAEGARPWRHAEGPGVGTTGYAKDILKDVLAADVALVETVAHTESALHFYPRRT